MIAHDPRPDEARALAIMGVWGGLNASVKLARAGAAEHVGPCPVCGGTDRFSINEVKNVFNCRRCLIAGDPIALVQHVRACTFPEALDYLCGARDVEIDPQVQAERDAAAEADRQQRERAKADYRRDAIIAARAIWGRAVPAEGTVVADYLRLRGLVLDAMPAALRFIADHVYAKGWGAQRVIYHSGPAMIAAVMSPRNELTAVHQTWIDLTRPKGKAEIAHPETGAAQPAKLVRGSKQGGAIRLVSSDAMRASGGGDVVIAEGIETVLTARSRDAVPGASYWAGLDLGHMGGRMRRVPGQRYSGIPDMDDDDALTLPRGLSSLTFVQDGDSDPVKTRALMLSGLRRAEMRQRGLPIYLVHPGAGRDLNDLVMVDAAPEGEVAP